MAMGMEQEVIHRYFEKELRNVVKNYIAELGGDRDDNDVVLFFHEGHYRRVKNTFQTVTTEELERFRQQGKHRMRWPFNDEKLV